MKREREDEGSVRCEWTAESLSTPPTRGIARADVFGDGAPVFVSRHAPRGKVTEGRAVTHPFAALALCTGGSSSLEQGGRWTVAEGDVMLVPPGLPHRVLEARSPSMLGVGFSASCLTADEAARLLAPFDRVRRGASAVVHIPNERQALLRTLLEELDDATKRRSSEPLVIQKSLLTLVVHEVERAGTWDVAPARSTGIVADALSFIERNCLSRITLGDVARAVHRSPAHVTTALGRATGRSAGAWIIAGRMAEARRLLLHTDEIVEVVSERVGYADPTHFIRLFRREHGSTPAAWRALAARRAS